MVINVDLYKKYEDFYKEFHRYAKAKKALKGKNKSDCPKSCLKGFENREKTISDFEKKYL